MNCEKCGKPRSSGQQDLLCECPGEDVELIDVEARSIITYTNPEKCKDCLVGFKDYDYEGFGAIHESNRNKDGFYVLHEDCDYVFKYCPECGRKL